MRAAQKRYRKHGERHTRAPPADGESSPTRRTAPSSAVETMLHTKWCTYLWSDRAYCVDDRFQSVVGVVFICCKQKLCVRCKGQSRRFRSQAGWMKGIVCVGSRGILAHGNADGGWGRKRKEKSLLKEYFAASTPAATVPFLVVVKPVYIIFIMWSVAITKSMHRGGYYSRIFIFTRYRVLQVESARKYQQ